MVIKQCSNNIQDIYTVEKNYSESYLLLVLDIK